MITLVNVPITVRASPAVSTSASVARNEILCTDINDLVG